MIKLCYEKSSVAAVAASHCQSLPVTASHCHIGKLSQWSLGATWTHMVAGKGKGVVGGLSGQQVGCDVLFDVLVCFFCN
jgi:uncharacterized membrane protein